MARKCADCPAETVKVCRHTFGVNWGDKSRNGEGCDHPLDDVAEAWKAAGWKGETVPFQLPKAPELPRRPVRPKVSANILRQAEIFFGRKS